MKVRDLLEFLKSVDPELDVWGYAHGYDGREGQGPMPDNKAPFEVYKAGEWYDCDFLIINEDID